MVRRVAVLNFCDRIVKIQSSQLSLIIRLNTVCVEGIVTNSPHSVLSL